MLIGAHAVVRVQNFIIWRNDIGDAVCNAWHHGHGGIVGFHDLFVCIRRNSKLAAAGAL